MKKSENLRILHKLIGNSLGDNNMTEESIKTGYEILDEYFKQLIQDGNIDPEVRKIMKELWEQKRLSTTTYLMREIELLIEKRSK